MCRDAPICWPIIIIGIWSPHRLHQPIGKKDFQMAAAGIYLCSHQFCTVQYHVFTDCSYHLFHDSGHVSRNALCGLKAPKIIKNH